MKKDACECKSSEGLFMPSRQVGLILAALILAGFVLFAGAFFWGQKNAITSFTNKIEQESFGDQIYSSLCSLCDSQGDTEESEENSEERADLEMTQDEEIKTEAKDEQQVGSQEQALDSALQEEEIEEASSGVQEFYAQLAGFGTMRAAQHFASRLQKKEVSVIVKKRQSRSSRGRFVSWYQVVTEKFNDRGDLEALVKRLEYEEKLNDVRIVTC